MPLVKLWNMPLMRSALDHLDQLKGFMPPFIGTDAEKTALAEYLMTLTSEGLIADTISTPDSTADPVNDRRRRAAMTSPYPPIPGSPFLLDHLLGLVFVIHILFMNYLIAAPVLALFYLWTHPTQGKPFTRWLAAPLPVMFTFAITFGVASLLFVQVLFAERFFTANIILGNLWLAVIGLLMAAFYGAYILKRIVAKETGGRFAGGLAAAAVAALVWGIALVMIGNYFITTDREHWMTLLGASWRIIHQMTFVPRALHFITGAFAVTGFWMVWMAWWRSRRGAPQAAVKAFRRQGLWLATGATGVQISVGVWLLIWSPVETWDALFSGSFISLVWISGVATGLVMFGFLIMAAVFPDRGLWKKVSTALLGWTLFGMVAGREAVRQLAFGADFHLRELPHAVQSGAMLAFLALAVAGAAVIGWLIWRVWRLPPAKTDNDQPLDL